MSEGCGCTDDGRTIPNILDVAVQGRAERLVAASALVGEQEDPGFESGLLEQPIRRYDRDPRVADYESGESLLREWTEQCN